MSSGWPWPHAPSVRVQVDNLRGDSLGRGVVPGQVESGGVLGYFKRLDPPAAVEPGQVGQEAQVARVAGGGFAATSRRRSARSWAVNQQAEQLAMLPLRSEPFDPARLLQARVDHRARVCVRQY